MSLTYGELLEQLKEATPAELCSDVTIGWRREDGTEYFMVDALSPIDHEDTQILCDGHPILYVYENG